jgi:hypothetical protein
MAADSQCEGAKIPRCKVHPLLSALALIALIAPLRAEFLYVAYRKGLLSFSINPVTGALTKLPGTPTLFSGGVSSITLDHTGKLLYAIHRF